MDGIALQDLINRGLGRAARKIGLEYSVYRPSGPVSPILPRNRVIKLYAGFVADEASAQMVAAPLPPMCCGVFDAAYTLPGDYLVSASETYFIAAQVTGDPALCVRTNRVLSAVRQPPPTVAGYGGRVRGQDTSLLQEWPASVIGVSGRGDRTDAREARFATFTVLLPSLPVVLRVADILTDEFGQTYVIDGAEQSATGWQAMARQVAA